MPKDLMSTHRILKFISRSEVISCLGKIDDAWLKLSYGKHFHQPPAPYATTMLLCRLEEHVCGGRDLMWVSGGVEQKRLNATHRRRILGDASSKMASETFASAWSPPLFSPVTLPSRWQCQPLSWISLFWVNTQYLHHHLFGCLEKTLTVFG